MSGFLKKLRKLKGRSLHEFGVRGAQVLAAGAERYGVSARARVPADAAFFGKLEDASARARSAETLLADFRARTPDQFFAAFASPAETRAELCRRFGAGRESAAVARARRITEGRFDLLGFRNLSFGDPPDWHLEPISHKRAPLVHWSRVPYLDPRVAGDKKITWELNRHQYFSTLGRAYWLTGDELYSETFASHLESWMDANPPKLGINWASSLELSFRAISWLWALHFFRESKHLSPALYLRALKYLYLHARHLETYLSTYFSPNTHLTGEALGLYYLGTALPEFREAARWRERGRDILLGELDKQVRADGVYFEQTSYYHRYTAEFYTHFYLLSRANGRAIERKLTDKLALLLDYLMYITRPDGTSPRVGDDDGGRLVMLDERAPNDFRSALATAAALFARGDYKQVAERATEETLWLLGPEGLRAFDAVEPARPAGESRAFEEGGYFVMRDGWAKNSNYLLVDCGPHGAVNSAHAHADALSIELAARGRPLLVDAGTYTYTGSPELRDLFRSSAMHNTVTVDDESSSVPGGTFQWLHVAHSTLRCWLTHPRFDYFEGAHDGYERLADPATHARSILFLKNRYWVMRDRVDSRGAHRYGLHFHFSPEADPRSGVENEAAVVREAAGAGSGLEILTFGGAVAARESWVSPCYGQRQPAPGFSISAEARGRHEFITFMTPLSEPRVMNTPARELSAEGGRLFEVRAEGARDFVMACDADAVEGGRFVSDFSWAWARFAADGARLEELVLVRGSRFLLDGRPVFESRERAAYVVARRVGGELLVETDAGARVRVALEDEGARSGRAYSV
ncbi:MAG TPA: alginate lyase family protein [Pyrinomonadaceae bacterium]|jgi:hypothetical protein